MLSDDFNDILQFWVINFDVTKDRELYLLSLYWIPTLHECTFKQRYFAGFAKCSTKPISKSLICILSAVKTKLQSYCDTSYLRGGVNHMWYLQKSNDLLQYIQSRSRSRCNSIKTFDFSILYKTIHHSQLKDRLSELVQMCFTKWPTQIQIPGTRKGQILFCKNKNTLILLISSLKLISTCSRF